MRVPVLPTTLPSPTADNKSALMPDRDEASAARGRSAIARERSPAARNRVAALLVDKLGERLAFERDGRSLYDAFIVKYATLLVAGSRPLPRAEQVLSERSLTPTPTHLVGESVHATLERIRSEELAHFQMLAEAIQALGGDPMVDTSSAATVLPVSGGVMRVIKDPATNLAQALNALVAVELIDNAGWELLIRLAQEANQHELINPLVDACKQEREHLVIVKSWLGSLALDQLAGALDGDPAMP